MDLRLLEVFCRVYKERSFSRAARELGLTQPTVSAHIKELEEAVGTQLFNRLAREIQPTEAGRVLYEQSKSLLSLKRSLVEKMAVFLNRVEGVLTVGASSVPGEYLLPVLVTGFHAKHPGVRARLRITDTAETIDDLRHGEVSILGVVGGGTWRTRTSCSSRWPAARSALAVPTTPEWKNRKQVTLRELRELPLVVRESGSGNRTDSSARSRSGRCRSPISTSRRSLEAWAPSRRRSGRATVSHSCPSSPLRPNVTRGQCRSPACASSG